MRRMMNNRTPITQPMMSPIGGDEGDEDPWVSLVPVRVLAGATITDVTMPLIVKICTDSTLSHFSDKEQGALTRGTS
jgi:hypothetical protein